MISVIIPTYNGAKLLLKYSLPSLLRQNYPDWEALIIDDGSTDNSADLINNFIKCDQRFKLIEQKNNLGLAAALNLGVKEASGDYIAILEHDDIWLSDKLSRQVKVMAEGAKISSCQAIVYNQTKQSFDKINGGNFSCLIFNRLVTPSIFPLPEENKKYLGIEDGLLAARLAILKGEGQINNQESRHIAEILTIMNSSAATLSGLKDSLIMKARYKNALDLFLVARGKYSELDALILFWKKHYYYNLLLSLLPDFIKKIIYSLIDKLKTIKNRRSLSTFRQTEEYQKLKNYRALFD